MFGLNKYTEEYFNHFKGANLRYISNASTIFGGILICNLIMLGLEFMISYLAELEYYKFIGIVMAFLIAIYLFILSLSKDKNHKFKFQKFIVICEVLNYFIFSISLYGLAFVFVDLNNFKGIRIGIVAGTITLGFIYLVYMFVRLVIQIKMGNTRGETCREAVFGKLFSKIAYLSFSIPIIVVFNKVVRRASIVMSNGNNNDGILILVLALALMIQVLISMFIPEGLILIYCKFRFKTFNITEKSENRRS